MTRFIASGFIFYHDKLLVVFHKRLKKWMHVGGHVENDELFDDALRREIREEVNLDIVILDKGERDRLSGPDVKDHLEDLKIAFMHKPLFIHSLSNEGYDVIAIDYICLAKDISGLRIQESELDAYKWVSKDDIKDLDMFPVLKVLALKAFDYLQGTEL